ncbi:similar to Saccharomyces cerevisiae YIL039W TED1 Conserved phosphoesterase domain-containing protein that acts together with Emp24p/Erv25p in cargo exit from the ER [Maudiozyma saulgeensis]|uniref:Similar to Saccharomyces cerevisiae YIL039W TED1 Conserved phosphoesterase domain-containing protein that acts together with Emp24p/Erv25p in cargo exit from the ER n=1 Tax=Maudiozyma saulgeensis TaxID=1789683 RepID=A0A1X7R8Y4_9SACH|nr:similar to Saccharomyces cerevisiae YIL039W TED1 Conserved phosphoesterase domain-containing protein that acts together with Emp24p/Erv25p in cargo exit from the ER [Kazachstania saulgeensis]
MLKFYLKRFAIFATILTILINIYTFTYPSLDPENCSWHCFDNSVINAAPIGGSLFEKMNYYIKRYSNDVIKTHWNSETDLVNDKQRVNDIHMMALGDPQIKGVWHNTPYISRLDTFGNDYYLGHIFRTMKKRLSPSHVVVMGDLFSSQWIPDSEFYNRTRRYVDRLFKRDTSLIEEIKGENHEENENLFIVDWHKWADNFNENLNGNRNNFNFGYKDVKSWSDEEDYLFVNLTGNHDVGYSGDATYQHLTRFNTLFGKDNFWIEYDTETDHPWRLVVLNDLLLEGPALQPEFIDYDWEFLKQLVNQNFSGSTILATHVPFYKEEGLCVDPLEVNYYPEGWEKEPYKANLLRSQNHISESVTNKVFDMIFGNGKPGMVLVGHDHEGCEVIYNKFESNNSWVATKEPLADAKYHLQEITVRSMMGEFNGNTGLVSGHFNEDSKLWEWKFTLCPFSIQHVWWASKVTAIITLLAWSTLAVL